jgi:replicative DNA helicase
MHPVAAELLTAASFFQYEHGQIYSAIFELVSQGQPADVITVFEVLDRRGIAEDVGGLVYLNALAQSVPSAANLRRYCEIVNERKVLRELMAVTDDAWNSAMNLNGRSAADVVLEVLSKISALGRSVTEQGPARGIDAADLLCKDMPSPTYILKPFLAEGLTVLAASPKVGKTTLARQISEAVNCGSEVLGEKCTKGDVLFLSLGKVCITHGQACLSGGDDALRI